MFELGLWLVGCDPERGDTAEKADSTIYTSGGADTADTHPDTGPADSETAAAMSAYLLDELADVKVHGGIRGHDRGFAITTADLDGDGISELILSLDMALGSLGSTYILPPATSGTLSSTDATATLSGWWTNGSTREYSGDSVAGVGDTNGDGFDDLLIGAPSNFDNGDEGHVYLVQGPVPGDRSLADAEAYLAGEDCFDAWPDSECSTGSLVAPAGDTDGDGLADILIGAPGAVATYLVRGPVPATVDLGTESDVRIESPVEDLEPAGDLDGDGMDEFLLAKSSGDAYIQLLYTATTPAFATEADAETTFGGGSSIIGYAGSPADANGDGYGDLLIGAGGDDARGENAGAAYIVEGPVASGEVDVPVVASARFEGISAGDLAGHSAAHSLATLGDLDGDGLDDLAIGAYGVGGTAEDHATSPGAAYVLFSPFSGTRSLADADFALYGDGDDRAGTEVFGAGDTDGDGLPDLLVSGPDDDDGGNGAGAAWLVLGRTLMGG